ncbi:MAG: mechanosensitive ion channel domain-containing protein [Nanoarchaeota archaeon]|nr:mechanosensitive ion channel [Nanoarchaeota archaeon]MBU1030776.1 mechanosensitive ion channel [Nanoarchaeota archaeon]MBU1850508.1 mechanosensitive ion channel [Nanoarchaeota archaeon]
MTIGSQVGNAFASINPFLVKMVSGIIILLIGFIIGKIISKVINKILHEVDLDKGFKKTTGFEFSIENTISKIIAYLIYFIAIVMALNTIGLTTFVLNMLFGAIIIIVVISFILAIKDFVPNFISGYVLKKRGYFEPGIRIKIKDLEGVIIKVSLLETSIKTPNKDTVIIPNAIFTKSEVIIKS